MTATTPSVMDAMKKIPTSLPDVFVLEPRVFGDRTRILPGKLQRDGHCGTGNRDRFVQDNHSFSTRNVLRGTALPDSEHTGKTGRESRTEKSWMSPWTCAEALRHSEQSEAVRLSGENKRMMWIPAGFAHGFRVISETTHVLYKATDYLRPRVRANPRVERPRAEHRLGSRWRRPSCP